MSIHKKNKNTRNQEKAKSRLTDRLQSRTRKNLNKNVVVVPKLNSVVVPTPVLVPKIDIITVENINDVEKVIGCLKKAFKSPEMLAKCWGKIVKDSKESNGGRMGKKVFVKLIHSVFKKMKTNNTFELKQEKLIMGQLWDNVRNGSDAEDIGEEVLLKWVFS